MESNSSKSCGPLDPHITEFLQNTWKSAHFKPQDYCDNGVIYQKKSNFQKKKKAIEDFTSVIPALLLWRSTVWELGIFTSRLSE